SRHARSIPRRLHGATRADGLRGPRYARFADRRRRHDPGSTRAGGAAARQSHRGSRRRRTRGPVRAFSAPVRRRGAWRRRAGAEAEHVATYRAGLAALDQAALSSFAQTFVQCAPAAQDALIARLERDELADVPAAADGRTFFELLRAHLQEGLFADPAYGGN